MQEFVDAAGPNRELVGHLVRCGLLRGCADEGGYWPEFATNEEALATFAEAVEVAGYTLGKEAAMSLDIAASDLFDPADRSCHFRSEGRRFTSDEFMDLLARWCETYRVASIEDPAADTDWEGWQRFQEACGDRVQIIGDDLFTTNRMAKWNEVLRIGRDLGSASRFLGAGSLAPGPAGFAWNPAKTC